MNGDWPPELDALVADPGHHSLVLENEHVRVLDTKIGPGETTNLHTHRWPAAHYVLGWSDFVRRDEKGEITLDTREKGIKLSPGEALWSQPLPPHTLKNVGTASLHIISVEVKQEVKAAKDLSFLEAAEGLLRGDFSRLEPLFEPQADGRSQIEQWHAEGLFARHLAALDEALSCACFNGQTGAARYLLDQGVDPAEGNATGLDAFHWAANRGQVGAVKLLIQRGANMETINMYGGTALGNVIWCAIQEPRPGQIEVIKLLVDAGANIGKSGFPTGNPEIDRILQPR